MFDLHGALAQVNGAYDFEDLEKLLSQIRREHISEISPEIGVAELLLLARERKWIREDEDGMFHVDVKKAA